MSNIDFFAKKLKKKTQEVKAITVKNNQCKVTYKLVKSGITKKIRKLVSINKKGVITNKKWKKAKVGTYKIKVRITAKGNSKYKPRTLIKTAKITITYSYNGGGRPPPFLSALVGFYSKTNPCPLKQNKSRTGGLSRSVRK